ncbi:MAG: tryptophan 7-halogenase [Myxococcales bacterium]|nr:tryptophan 7-halogenase [Myxococcales bacterium]MDD9967472.1 tryptophan 7-halogenase [Myxococcales bacterium]
MARAGTTRDLRCRWFVDATGRRRLLQRKLGLQKEATGYGSALWFRVGERLSPDDLVDDSEVGWRLRVPDDRRYFSTSHFMGRGYWVWMIPLVGGETSIGIVAEEKEHPFSTYGTRDRAMAWLAQHEPALYRAIADLELLDCRKVQRYTYGAEQVFSSDRWACVGESSMFADPLYSPGMDFIGFENCIVSRMIAEDAADSLTQERVAYFNRFILSHFETTLSLSRDAFGVFEWPHVTGAKLVWDFYLYWAFTCEIFFRKLVTHHPEVAAGVGEVGTRVVRVNQRVQRLLSDWAAAAASPTPGYEFVDVPSQVPFLESCHGELSRDKTAGEALRGMMNSLRTVEVLAQVILLAAVAEVHPSHAAALARRPWLNAWAVGLDPNAWERDGLFRPTTPPADRSVIGSQLRWLFPAQRTLEGAA